MTTPSGGFVVGHSGRASSQLSWPPRLLTEVTAEPDPFDFVGSFASDTVAARDTDAYLSEHGFGR
jgi:hypothetical protein